MSTRVTEIRPNLLGQFRVNLPTHLGKQYLVRVNITLLQLFQELFQGSGFLTSRLINICHHEHGFRCRGCGEILRRELSQILFVFLNPRTELRKSMLESPHGRCQHQGEDKHGLEPPTLGFATHRGAYYQQYRNNKALILSPLNPVPTGPKTIQQICSTSSSWAILRPTPRQQSP